MKDFVKLIRVKHYVKNILIFLPLVFSRQLFNFDKLKLTIIGTISFWLLVSAIYIFNDIHDMEKDRNHPIKKLRPIASGKISKKQAYIYMIIFIILCIISNIILFLIGNMPVSQITSISIIEITYFTIYICYSKGLKNIPIMDVTILVLGFILRIVLGANITNITISKWLYLTIMAGAFYMGLGKRRNEVIKQNGDTSSREVLKKYNKEFLDKFMYCCLTLSIVFYSLWCIDETTISRIKNDYMIYTIPLVLVILMKYSLNIENDSFGDPIDVLLSDKILVSLVLLFAVSTVCIIYWV